MDHSTPRAGRHTAPPSSGRQTSGTGSSGNDQSSVVAPPNNALASEIATAVDALRAERPRIHALMPTVSQPLGANVAAALGVDVSMTGDPFGVRAMVPSSDAALINLGMMDQEKAAAAREVVKAGIPFVLDPVKVERDSERLAIARELVGAGCALVKGNRREMAALGPMDVPGVVIVTTGETDIVVEGARSVAVTNGTPLLDRVIATGCATGLLAAALLGATRAPFVSAVAAVAMMGVAGEHAARVANGPGSFAAALIDALHALDGRALAADLKLQR